MSQSELDELRRQGESMTESPDERLATLKMLMAGHMPGSYSHAALAEAIRRWPLADEVERLNQLLRDTGYGQGQIDAATVALEENERLNDQIAALVKAGDALEASCWCKDQNPPDRPCSYCRAWRAAKESTPVPPLPPQEPSQPRP